MSSYRSHYPCSNICVDMNCSTNTQKGGKNLLHRKEVFATSKRLAKALRNQNFYASRQWKGT